MEMKWTKVTPDTVPFVKDGMIVSDRVWVTILDKKTGNKRVEMSHYVKAKNIFDDSMMNWFQCAVELKKDIGGEHFEKKENIEVTHWKPIEYPDPAKDDETTSGKKCITIDDLKIRMTPAALEAFNAGMIGTIRVVKIGDDE